MKRRFFIRPGRFDVELAQALSEWIAASRRAFDPAHDARDERAEHAAWRRLQSALAADGAPKAAKVA